MMGNSFHLRVEVVFYSHASRHLGLRNFVSFYLGISAVFTRHLDDGQ